VKEYSKEQQVKLADEIKGASPNASFPDMMRDYAVLRAQLRECR
jgi:hypothetical protein